EVLLEGEDARQIHSIEEGAAHEVHATVDHVGRAMPGGLEADDACAFEPHATVADTVLDARQRDGHGAPRSVAFSVAQNRAIAEPQDAVAVERPDGIDSRERQGAADGAAGSKLFLLDGVTDRQHSIARAEMLDDGIAAIPDREDDGPEALLRQIIQQ